MKQLGCCQCPHQGVDPHRHDEEHDGHCASVEVLVREYPGGRIAEQDADGRILYRHLEGEGEGLYGIAVREELGEVGQGEVSAAVLEGIDHDQDQRERDKQH